jgi:Arc/MetJ-type ribon-helix-helix transcriptional regulator
MRAPDLGDLETPIRPPEASDSVRFNYGMLAELFIGKGQGAKYRTITYRRFTNGSDAIRYAIEELPPGKLTSTVLQVDEIRFDSREIRKLYDGPDYPLQRRALARAGSGMTRIAPIGSAARHGDRPGTRAAATAPFVST